MNKLYETKQYCGYTGIALSYALPANCKFRISITHSYSEFTVANSIPTEVLDTLGVEDLAGIVLTIYNKYELFTTYSNDSKTNNFILSTVGSSKLLRAIALSKSYTRKNMNLLPAFDLELSTHTETSTEKDVDFSEVFKEYLNKVEEKLKEIGDVLPQRIIPIRGTSFYNEQIPLAQRLATKTMNKELADKLVEARVAYKEVSSTLVALEHKKLSTVIKSILSGETVRTVDNSIKTKVIDRLSDIIENCTDNADTINLAIIQDMLSFSMNRNLLNETTLQISSAIPVTDAKPKTIAEMIAMKKESNNG